MLADKKREPNKICVFFFGTHNYGWVYQSQIYLYVKEDKEYRAKNDPKKLKDAKDEAEKWMDRYQEISEKNVKCSNKNTEPPPQYKKIKSNKIVSKWARSKESEPNICKCRPEDPKPCSNDNNCHNALMKFECDPDLCPAKHKCQNQNFRHGQRYNFQVKKTKSKGWGLYAMEDIPVETFIIEYVGEVVNKDEFDQRFNRAKSNKQKNYYFLQLPDGLYIDAAIYGNESRFINHSCSPNTRTEKWAVFSNGKERIRIGFFTNRAIRKVRLYIFNFYFENLLKCNRYCFS